MNYNVYNQKATGLHSKCILRAESRGGHVGHLIAGDAID